MHFCLTATYTAQSLNAMRENPNTNRREAASNLIEAAGGKLINFFYTGVNGPGALVVFDVPDPEMATALVGVTAASGSLTDIRMTRLYTQDEINPIRQKARQLREAYKPPGEA